MKLRFLSLLFSLFAATICFGTPGQSSPDAVTSPAPVPVISLVTAEPGPEVFELYGHQGVRVNTPGGMDLTYNFGVFDFNSPNFVYRFVKGETDYMGAIFPTSLFLSEYEERGSKVTEQVLNLKPYEALRMAGALNEAIRPENAVYRYKYCTDNCATRVLDILESSLSSPVSYFDASPELDTYRKVMRRYDSAYPWYVLGVDVALGGTMDTVIGTRERMFVPMELMRSAADARLADGRKLVKQTNILVPGRGDVTEKPTPFLLTPVFWAWVILLFSLVALSRAMRHGWSRWRWWLCIWWTLCGAAGALSTFLIFISVHEGTSPNIIGWWLNPLWLIPAYTIFVPRWRRFTRCVLVMLSIMTGAMLLAWNISPHAVNGALMLACVTTLALSCGYILTGSSTHERRPHHHHGGKKKKA